MIGERAAAKLEMDDLHVICGEKSAYTLEDAKSLYKRQWTEDRYASKMDLSGGYSPPRMLEILRLRAQYLSDRGSTLNNPHIPKRFFLTFADRAIRVTVGRETTQTPTCERPSDGPLLRVGSSDASPLPMLAGGRLPKLGTSTIT